MTGLLPRSVSKLYAGLFGYFWVPCPVCGVEFGGQEWTGIRGRVGHFSSIPDGGSRSMSRGICAACTAAGHGCRAKATVGLYHLGCQFVTLPDVGSV
jgi:hypothetical protein